ncbi:MAG: hypothetical protein VB081_02135 [Christensenella sp.]|uniref:hypothetical protein n=1 Tax=Christensenella sp. TaxID=1935934 RepID=UPI002B20AD27|nr:hypothetical protein [Christensenella sp.]MEA5002279.1 hypothetical protein [Christensenella sp.]
MHIEFGSDIDTQANTDYVREAGENHFWDKACLFRSGRDALRLLAKSLYPAHKRAFMPVLSCPSMTEPFQKNGFQVVYYPMRKDFSADDHFLDEHLADGDVLLHMNYFGIAPEHGHIHRQLRNLVTIDDRTHSLRQAMEAQCCADHMLFSVRKWVSLADGGLLLSKKQIRPNYDVYDSAYRDAKQQAMDKKSAYLQNGAPETKETFLRLFAQAEQQLDSDNSVMEMSKESARVLKTTDFSSVEIKRKKNAELLFQMLPEYALLPHVKEGPLFFPVMVKNQKEAQEHLAQNNIYCPVIWPIQQSASGVCAFSENIAAHMLAVPCDQRYSPKEIEYIGGKVREAARP